MLIGGDLGFFFSVVVVVVGWLLTSRKWRRASARRVEIRRLMALASEEAARAEFEATSTYKIYASSLTPEPVAVESATGCGRQLQYQCEVCFRPTTTRCKQCKAVRYCSRKCQVVHWRQGHKDECHLLTTIDVGVHSCIKEFEQDGSKQNAIGIEEMNTIESSPEVPNPNFNECGDNVDIETEVSNKRKENDVNVKAASVDECSSSTNSVETTIASDGNLNDYGQITCDVESTRSEQHSLINRAASNQLKFGRIYTDEKSESSILSEEYSPSSDFWTGTVERMRSRSNEVDDVNMSNYPTCSPSASRIKEMYVSGMDPCLATSMPNKSIEQLSLSCKLPGDSSSNTSSKCSSTEGSNLSSFSSCRGGISEGHDLSSLQSLKSDDESDGTSVILDTLKCQRNYPSGLSSTESHLSSNQVLQPDRTCHNGSSSFKSSSYVPSATNLRFVGQLRASDFIMRRCEGSFPYERFVKLYNWNNVELSPCGLINCGNSCYANAVLQCLAFTPPLAAYCLQGFHAKTCRIKEWCFMCEFEELVKKAKEGNNRPVSAASIMSQMGSHLGNGREEDAHEFLRYAIDAMQSVCLKEAKVNVPSSLVEETTLVGLTFGGYLQSKIECMRCGGKSKQNDRIMDLTAEIEGKDIASLEDALLQFTHSEILDGENKYHCGRCKSYEKAKKKLRVLEAPNVLVIALKRFQRGKFGKLNKVVKFPEILNLAPYMSGTSDKSPIYQLYGVVVHLDVMNAVFSGHYVCYIKNKQGRWFKADDSVVQEVELEKVLSNDAYILFYARCSPRAPRVIRRKVKNLCCNVKPPCPWDSGNGYFTEEEVSSSEYSSSYFSDTTYTESTDDNFDQILGRHDVDCSESTSSCSRSPKMQVRDRGSSSSISSSSSSSSSSSKEDLLGINTFLCSRVGCCSSSSSCMEKHSQQIRKQ